ncbi:crotonase/enoyl-CoA hydratase family protein [Sulfitobacter sp. LCG007]
MARVALEIADHVARIRLVRPEKRNAVDQEMIDAVIAAAADIAASEARVVILSGEGPDFCAGIDLEALSGLIGKDPGTAILPRTHGDGTTNQWQEFSLALRRLEIPVIAVLHGNVFGAGLQLALGADIRIAAPSARLAVMEMKWGIVPDMGGMVLLPRLVRSDVMRRLIYTAAPVDGAQAERCGLVTELAEDPMASAIELARAIAAKGPNAIRAAKRLIAMAETADEAEVLLAESREQAALIGRPEQMEVVAAQFAKRAPRFA